MSKAKKTPIEEIVIDYDAEMAKQRKKYEKLCAAKRKYDEEYKAIIEKFLNEHGYNDIVEFENSNGRTAYGRLCLFHHNVCGCNNADKHLDETPWTISFQHLNDQSRYYSDVTITDIAYRMKPVHKRHCNFENCMYYRDDVCTGDTHTFNSCLFREKINNTASQENASQTDVSNEKFEAIDDFGQTAYVCPKCGCEHASHSFTHVCVKCGFKETQ